MKQTIFILTIFLASLGAFSQTTATNFNCNDCSGVNHDLFSELGSGKVIVLCWVMPCSSCIPGTLTSYNVVHSFDAAYPGRVKIYIVDDYANTSCTSLNGWCNSNGFPNSTKFSNATIRMTDYGTAGMPKVVVVGNYNHKIYYNANNTVNAASLNTAIANALNDFSVGMPETGIKELGSISSYPNPVTDQVTFSFSLEKTSTITLTISNTLAQMAVKPEKYTFGPGEQTLSINTSGFKKGIYYARFQTDSGIKTAKFVVSR
jgi:predicted secreted protein